MGKKLIALALSALLVLGLSACDSGNNVSADKSYSSRSTNGDNSRGIMGDIGDGIDDAADDVGDAIRDAGDALSGDNRRFQEMLENARVHDTDGFLLDGENRHD